MKRSIYSLLAALALAASMLFGIPGAAGAAPEAPAAYGAATDDVSIQAWPTGCRHESIAGEGYRAKCDRSNGGSWHAVVICMPTDGGDTFQRFGPWRKSGWSTVYCPVLTNSRGGFMIERSS
jgi:hypothetical protein